MKIIRSTYRDGEKNQFEMEVIRETKDTYICRFLPQWKHEFQDGDSEHEIRKCIVGERGIYKLIEREQVQMSLFD